ncbi:MAG: anthranilate phosphoribosyltransferase [Idiomarinaceae bacterium]|nr:anthranilate phosphoribosyltransferase [Idiomarinaceae bacterium]
MNEITTLLEGRPLSQDESQKLFRHLVKGELNDAQISAALVAMKLRGETPAELAGAARAVLDVSKPLTSTNAILADSCGTGGDGSNSINLSTTSALVASSMGLPMAKHGNRSVSSRSGSADVLESLGLRVDLDPREASKQLADHGFCFLFAPHYHPGIKHAMPVRQTLKTRTLFNLIGPLVNPARPNIQLLGVYSPIWLQPMAETLQRLGTERAMVVHGSGVDEFALHGTTEVVELRDNQLEQYTLSVSDFGLNEAPLSELKGGDADFNATVLKRILAGQGSRAQNHAIAINTAPLLVMADKFSDYKQAAQAVLEHLASGAAMTHLEAIQAVQGGIYVE